MPRFPIEYDVELVQHSASPYELRAGDRPPVAAGPPIEFGGSGAWWSPEHLLVSAAASCFAATFAAEAARAHLRIGSLHCRARGVLDPTPAGISFTAIHLGVQLRVIADDVAKARALVDVAKGRCFVAASLRCPVEVTAEVAAS